MVRRAVAVSCAVSQFSLILTFLGRSLRLVQAPWAWHGCVCGMLYGPSRAVVPHDGFPPFSYSSRMRFRTASDLRGPSSVRQKSSLRSSFTACFRLERPLSSAQEPMVLAAPVIHNTGGARCRGPARYANDTLTYTLRAERLHHTRQLVLERLRPAVHVFVIAPRASRRPPAL